MITANAVQSNCIISHWYTYTDRKRLSEDKKTLPSTVSWEKIIILYTIIVEEYNSIISSSSNLSRPFFPTKKKRFVSLFFKKGNDCRV